MSDMIVATILTGVGTTAAILFGIWRMFAHRAARNDAAHADLARRIDRLDTDLGERLERS